MLEGIIASLIATVVGGFLVVAWKSRSRLLRVIWILLFHRAHLVRISFSTIISIRRGDELVLVRMLRRPEALGPFGGVYKLYADGLRAIEEMGFSPQSAASGDEILMGDLRGFIPGASLFKLLVWFDQGRGRETETDCARRELREELVEIGLGELVPRVSDLRFTRLRRVHEGPRRLGEAYNYLQLRIFDVLELAGEESVNQSFLDELFRRSQEGSHLFRVTASEIRKGRTSKALIGNHVCYLIGSKALRPELPPF